MFVVPNVTYLIADLTTGEFCFAEHTHTPLFGQKIRLGAVIKLPLR